MWLLAGMFIAQIGTLIAVALCARSQCLSAKVLQVIIKRLDTANDLARYGKRPRPSPPTAI